MRATSDRRRASARGSRYAGSPGTPVRPRHRNYEGDGPAFVCPDCGARVASRQPRHRIGGGQPKPWNVCGTQPVANDFVALAMFTRTQADRLYLVTIAQIAKRFEVSETAIRGLRRLPSPVARLDSQAAPGLYYAPAVEAVVKQEKPDWLRGSSPMVGGPRK